MSDFEDKQYGILVEDKKGIRIMNVWAIDKKEAYEKLFNSKFKQFLRNEDEVFEVVASFSL